jgi:hypothetical protein
MAAGSATFGGPLLARLLIASTVFRAALIQRGLTITSTAPRRLRVDVRGADLVASPPAVRALRRRDLAFPRVLRRAAVSFPAQASSFASAAAEFKGTPPSPLALSQARFAGEYLHREKWRCAANHLWPPPGSIEPSAGGTRRRAPAGTDERCRYVFDAVIADLTAHPPG